MVDFNVFRHGKGDVAVIFVHGYLDNHAVWDEIVPLLGDAGAELVTFDTPGSGERTADTGPINTYRFAADLVALINDLAKPVVLVGHSLGAPVVELAALAVGDRVRGLILVCPAPWAGAHHSVEAAESFSSFAGKEQEILAVRKREVVTMPREGVLDGLSASAARIRPEVIRDLVAVWNEGLAWPSAISDYTGPTFILSGSGDAAITSEMFNNGVLPRFPAAKTFVLEASSHWPHIEEPAATATHLARILESLPMQ